MRRLLISAVTLPALLLASGCTGDSPESGSRSGSTEAVGEDRGVELTQENFVDEISAAQLEAGTVHVVTTSSLGGQDLALEGEAALAEDPEDRAAALTMDLSALGAGDEPMDLRMIGQVAYVNLGEATGGDFYRVDLADDEDPMGAELAGMLDQADPIAQFEVLGDSVTGFSEDGDDDEIDGVPTTRYTLTVDPIAMYEAQGLSPDAMTGLPESMDYVLYVGRDHLPRRLEVEVPGTGMSTVEWSQWGEDVVIEAPHEDQITDEPPAA